MNVVHVIVPDGVDDPERPSGGNHYDRRLCQALARRGWSVREHAVPGAWPAPDAAALSALAGVLDALPDDAVVLLDGLVAAAAPRVLVPRASRLRPVVLVHMPLGVAGGAGERDGERRVLGCAAAVLATSGWTREWLVERYALESARVRVAHPGVDPADLAAGGADGGALLCVAAVTPHKGQDVLLAALARVRDLSWRCACVGSLSRDPCYVARLRRQAGGDGIGGRVDFAGTRTGADLDAAYRAADLLVLASRAETYGMVVTEALARGLPVLATAVGGLPEALGRAPGGARPGMLVPPDDPVALAGALRRWLTDGTLRRRLRGAARMRRAELPGWAATAEAVDRVLSGVA